METHGTPFTDPHPARDATPRGGTERSSVSGAVTSAIQEGDGTMPRFEHNTVYNMVSTCNRQLAILRRIRDRQRRSGETGGRNIDFDIDNMERIQRLLVAMERGWHPEQAPVRDRRVVPLFPRVGPRPHSGRGARGRGPTPWLPGFGD